MQPSRSLCGVQPALAMLAARAVVVNNPAVVQRRASCMSWLLERGGAAGLQGDNRDARAIPDRPADPHEARLKPSPSPRRPVAMDPALNLLIAAALLGVPAADPIPSIAFSPTEG